MADEEPKNRFGNVSLPLFSREKTKGAARLVATAAYRSSILKIR
jgi:hypothetical protein